MQVAMFALKVVMQTDNLLHDVCVALTKAWPALAKLYIRTYG